MPAIVFDATKPAPARRLVESVAQQVLTVPRTVVAWQYGLLPPLDWTAEAEAQAATRQTALWNALVAIEEERLRGENEIYRKADHRLSMVMARLAAIAAVLAAIPWRGADAEQRRLRRQLYAERAALWAESRPLRARVRAERAAEFTALRDARFAAVKAARQPAASGLWWGNGNAVCNAFDVALGRLNPGERVRPKRHGRLGETDARLTNQIQNGIPAETLLARGHSQV